MKKDHIDTAQIDFDLCMNINIKNLSEYDDTYMY